MNIFERENAWLGAADFVAGHDTLESFLSQARMIRRRLGTHAYKLDEYIRQLLIACSTPLDEVFSADDPLTRPLSAQCRRAAQGLPPEQERQDIFAQEVQEYAAKHPLPNQEANTRYLIYFCHMVGKFLHEHLPTLVQDIWYDTETRMDSALLDKLYSEICGILGSETDMEKLNELFAKRFLAVPMLHFAFQITSNALAELLLERDPETSREIIRLLLDAEDAQTP